MPEANRVFCIAPRTNVVTPQNLAYSTSHTNKHYYLYLSLADFITTKMSWQSPSQVADDESEVATVYSQDIPDYNLDEWALETGNHLSFALEFEFVMHYKVEEYLNEVSEIPVFTSEYEVTQIEAIVQKQEDTSELIFKRRFRGRR
jgi:hypothetical protein